MNSCVFVQSEVGSLQTPKLMMSLVYILWETNIFKSFIGLY